MDNKALLVRAIVTAFIWLMVAGTVALTGIFLAPEIGEDALGAIFMVLGAAILTNGFIWNWGRGNQMSKHKMRKRQAMEDDLYDMALHQSEKRKRDDIGSRLSDLSDDELVDFRERLQTGEIDEAELAYLLRQ